MKPFLTLLAFIVLLPQASALQAGESLYISLPPEQVQCVQFQLPDDSGVFTSGLFDYELRSTAEWGDLTEQTVTTDENNTVRVPMCFSSFGRSEGECSRTYSVSIASPDLDVSRSFGGGVCVSSIPDIDFVPASQDPPENPMDALNDNADIFSIGFLQEVVYTDSGEATLALLAESYASVTLDIFAEGLDPENMAVELSPKNPKQSIEFTKQGTGSVVVKARIRGCSGSHCYGEASAEVREKAGTELVGFSLSLLPRSLNVKRLDPVKYELVITNYGQEAEFKVELALPEGMESPFSSQSLSIDGSESIRFEVTPQKESAQYQLLAKVTSLGNSKQATAYLSTNELLTDALREAEEVKRQNPDASGEVDEQLDSWYESYKSKAYGEELEEYEGFKSALESMKPPTDQENQTRQTPAPSQPLPEEEPADYTVLIITALVLAAVAVWAVVIRKRSGRKEASVPKDF